MARFLVMLGLTILVFSAAPAFAQEAGAEGNQTKMALALASGFGIAIAAFGGAIAQGRAATAALDGIARNPSASGRIQVPMIIALALIESLVIYALIIAFMLQGKI
ncbi:MAG: ATP synthase F0 subunit C [Nitrospirota bacterium]|nr:ATP synthase F0 subunit C [Nitrospirota bacterium]